MANNLRCRKDSEARMNGEGSLSQMGKDTLYNPNKAKEFAKAKADLQAHDGIPNHLTFHKLLSTYTEGIKQSPIL